MAAYDIQEECINPLLRMCDSLRDGEIPKMPKALEVLADGAKSDGQVGLQKSCEASIEGAEKFTAMFSKFVDSLETFTRSQKARLEAQGIEVP